MATKLILGIDAGLNEVKVVGPRGELKFPSRVWERPGNHIDFSAFSSQKVDDIKFVVEYNGAVNFIGEHAEFENVFEETTAGNRDGSKNDDEAFLKAIGAVCRYLDTYMDFEDEVIEVYMYYGSPIKNWANPTERAQIESRFKNNGKAHKIIFNDIPLEIKFEEARVMPEGIAAFYSQAMTQREVYIVDAGSQTINLTAFIGGRPANKSKNTTNGVERFKELHGPGAASRLARTVLKEINTLKWGTETEGKYTLYVCGGFAAQLADAFNALEDERFEMQLMRPEVVVNRKVKTLDPIYANAAGMYFYAKGKYTSLVKG